jgi:hypothetical protein
LPIPRFFLALSPLVFHVLAAAAMAQNAAPEPPASSTPAAEPPTTLQLAPPGGPPDPPWVIRIDPMVWWVSPAGDLKLPSTSGSDDSVELSSLNLDTPEFTPAGGLAINAGDFRFSFFAAAYSRETTAGAESAFQIGDASFGAGDPFESEFDFNLFDLNVGYRFYTYDWRSHSADKDKCLDVVLDLYAVGGGRFYDMNIGVNAPGAEGNDTDQFFGDIVGGVRAEFTVIRDFSINLQLTGGGMGDSDRSSFSYDIQLNGEWRPWTNVGVLIGWRHIGFSLVDGDGAGKFDFDGTLAGLFAGVTVRF